MPPPTVVRKPMICAAQPTAIGDHGHRTYRLRKHAHRPLPMPALMDPIYLAARTRPKTATWESRPDSSALAHRQKELSLNPYARALATPIRQDALTKARLPTHFLNAFVLDMPRPDEAEGSVKRPAAALKTARESDHRREKNYILGTREALEHINRKGRWAVLISETMRKKHALRRQKNWENVDPKKEFEWHSKMPDVVLRDLSEAVLRHLKDTLLNTPELICRPSDESQVRPDDIACVLSFRGFEAGASEETPIPVRPQAREHIFSGQPVCDLSVLFPATDLDAFCAHHGIVDDRMALLKDPHHLATLHWIEKLRNYIGSPD